MMLFQTVAQAELLAKPPVFVSWVLVHLSPHLPHLGFVLFFKHYLFCIYAHRHVCAVHVTGTAVRTLLPGTTLRPWGLITSFSLSSLTSHHLNPNVVFTVFLAPSGYFTEWCRQVMISKAMGFLSSGIFSPKAHSHISTFLHYSALTLCTHQCNTPSSSHTMIACC